MVHGRPSEHFVCVLWLAGWGAAETTTHYDV